MYWFPINISELTDSVALETEISWLWWTTASIMNCRSEPLLGTAAGLALIDLMLIVVVTGIGELSAHHWNPRPHSAHGCPLVML
jgi:hypothetical protein